MNTKEMEAVKKKIRKAIMDDVHYLATHSFNGLKSEQSFDLGCVDYKIDNLGTRLDSLVHNLSHIATEAAFKAVLPIAEKEAVAKNINRLKNII